MKKHFILTILIICTLIFTGCVTKDNNNVFDEPRFKKLKSDYKVYRLRSYRLILGFTPDAGMIIADKKKKDKEYISFIDTKTAKEEASIEYDQSNWIVSQKRARWSNGGKSFVLSDAWDTPVETKYSFQSPVRIINTQNFTMKTIGDKHLTDENNIVCSASYGYNQKDVIYSVYNLNKPGEIYRYDKKTKRLYSDMSHSGVVSVIQLTENKYLESRDTPTEDEIYFVKNKNVTTVAKVKGKQRGLYIKDYNKNRRRLLYFESSLITSGKEFVGEKIIPRIIEFDDKYDEFEIENIKLSEEYEVLNGILSPEGRYAVFIVYHDNKFKMILYDINLSKSYKLLDNTDIQANFMGTLPGRIDGLFMSENHKICLVADSGVYIFELD